MFSSGFHMHAQKCVHLHTHMQIKYLSHTISSSKGTASFLTVCSQIAYPPEVLGCTCFLAFGISAGCLSSLAHGPFCLQGQRCSGFSVYELCFHHHLSSFTLTCGDPVHADKPIYYLENPEEPSCTKILHLVISAKSCLPCVVL